MMGIRKEMTPRVGVVDVTKRSISAANLNKHNIDLSVRRFATHCASPLLAKPLGGVL